MKRYLAALALLALAGCGDDDPPPPWEGIHWTSNGYAREDDVLEVMSKGAWGSFPPCEFPQGGAYYVELYKFSGSEPRDVRLVGDSPCPFSGRVRVRGNFVCTAESTGSTYPGIVLVTDR